MSTRAVIARQTNDGWEGIYQHSDGYPTGLGRELWSALHHEHGGNVFEFLHVVIDSHPGGWSHFEPAIPAELWDAYKESGFSPEFFAAHPIRECYCHSSRFVMRDGSCARDSRNYRAGAPSGWIIYDPSSDGAGGLEWAYCFGAGSLTIFAALPSDVRRMGDAYQTATGHISQCRPNAWQVVGIYSLRGNEPDWQVLECGRNFERCCHYAWAHLSGDERVRVKSDPMLSRLLMRDYVRANGNRG